MINHLAGIEYFWQQFELILLGKVHHSNQVTRDYLSISFLIPTENTMRKFSTEWNGNDLI